MFLWENHVWVAGCLFDFLLFGEFQGGQMSRKRWFLGVEVLLSPEQSSTGTAITGPERNLDVHEFPKNLHNTNQKFQQIQEKNPIVVPGFTVDAP